MADPLAALPATFAAGATVAWTPAVPSAYGPTSGYTVKVRFRGGSVADVDADGATGTWVATLTASTSANLAPGVYTWQVAAERTVATVLERQVLATGTVSVTPNLATAVAGDLVSFAAQQLAACEAAIAARLSGNGAALAQYTIGNRSATYYTLDELYTLRNRLRAEVRREANGGRLPSVTFAFRRAG